MEIDHFKAMFSVAVAIIKNKPPGMSGREFAEVSACSLRRRDESWKEKAEELQQQVLRLRQEVLINRLTGNATAGPFSVHDHTYCSDPNAGSETPELLLPDPHPDSHLPEPPPPPCRPPSGPRGETTLPQVQFLQALLSLQRLEEPLWLGPDGAEVLVESVCQLLDLVVRMCRDAPPLGPSDIVLQACHIGDRALKLFCSQRLPAADFRRRVEAALRELTELLLHNKGLHRLQSSEKLMECLMTLGRSSMSKSFLLRHLLSQISALADRLEQGFQGQEEFPLVEHQNSCYLFQMVELLQNSQVPLGVEAGSEEQAGFCRHLEQRAFLLSEEVPLFVLSMWRIGKLLSSDR